MPEKLRSEPGAFAGAFDEAGNIRDDEAGVIRRFAYDDHAEVGLQRGERIVGDLGTRRRDARDQRAFAGVGIADEPDIGQQPEFQPQIALFARLAVFVLARRLMG